MINELTKKFNEITGYDREVNISSSRFITEIKNLIMENDEEDFIGDNELDWFIVFLNRNEYYDLIETKDLHKNSFLKLNELYSIGFEGEMYNDVQHLRTYDYVFDVEFAHSLDTRVQRLYYLTRSFDIINDYDFDEFWDVLTHPKLNIGLFLENINNILDENVLNNIIEKLTTVLFKHKHEIPQKIKNDLIENMFIYKNVQTVYYPLIFDLDISVELIYEDPMVYINSSFDDLTQFYEPEVVDAIISEVSILDIDSKNMFTYVMTTFGLNHFTSSLMYSYEEIKSMFKQYLPNDEMEIDMPKLALELNSKHFEFFSIIKTVRPHWTRTLSILRPESREMI